MSIKLNTASTTAASSPAAAQAHTSMPESKTSPHARDSNAHRTLLLLTRQSKHSPRSAVLQQDKLTSQSPCPQHLLLRRRLLLQVRRQRSPAVPKVVSNIITQFNGLTL